MALKKVWWSPVFLEFILVGTWMSVNKDAKLFDWISDNSGKKFIKFKSNQKVHWDSSSEEHECAYNPIVFLICLNGGLRVTPPERPKLTNVFFFCRVSTYFCPYGVSWVYNFAVSSVKIHLFSMALSPQSASVPAGICCLQNISLPLNLTLPQLL